jgi:hypothetical protein
MRWSALALVAVLGLSPGCNPTRVSTSDPGRETQRDQIAAKLPEGVTIETADAAQLRNAAQAVIGKLHVVESARLLDDGNPETVDPVEIVFEKPSSAIPRTMAEKFFKGLKDFTIPGLVAAAIPAIAHGASMLLAWFSLRGTSAGGVQPKPLLSSKSMWAAGLGGGFATANGMQGWITDPAALSGILGVFAAIMAGLRGVTDKPLSGVVKAKEIPPA